jgi:hypothetical protein
VTEAQFRQRFDADQRDGKMTWVEGAIAKGIAVGSGTANGKGVILLRGGGHIPLEDAAFTTAPWDV